MAVFLAFAKNRGARSVVRSQDSDETVGVLCQKDQLGTANVKKKMKILPPPQKKCVSSPKSLIPQALFVYLRMSGRKRDTKRLKSPLSENTLGSRRRGSK